MAVKEMQQTPPIRSKTESPRENFIQKTWGEAVRYFKGVNAEFKRISWPTPQELRYNTLVVVFVVVGISLYMWLVNQGLNVIFRWLHRT